MGDNTSWRVAATGKALAVTASEPKKQPPLKWARHAASGHIRYIRSLDASERGADCGCVCVHCDSPLVAVNAAKAEGEHTVTPHFRHPAGSIRDGCVVLAARHAALACLIDAGEIWLPRRCFSGRAVGLSGKTYDAWVEVPARRARVRHAQVVDSAKAVLTLDDGRTLVVELVGAIGPIPAAADAGAAVGNLPVALVTVVVPSEFAIMDASEIVKRLELLPEAAWCGHWDDEMLRRQAAEKAQAQALAADDSMAWLGPEADAVLRALDPQLAGLSAEEVRRLRHESLLHLVVKRILADAASIWLPPLFVTQRRRVEDGKDTVLERYWSRPTERARFKSVELEKRLGRTVPDVAALRADAPAVPPPMHATNAPVPAVEDVLLIEVTVANHLDAERLQRIRAMNLPTLEIDLSSLGGRIDRQALADLVIKDLRFKKWVHHPAEVQARAALAALLDEEARPCEERFSEYAQQHREALAQPADYWRDVYLSAVREHSDLRAAREAGEATDDQTARALEAVRRAAFALAAHGWTQAEDEELFRRHACPLDRLLSLQHDVCVGYRLTSAYEVMNTVLGEQGERRRWHVIYILGLKYFKPRITLKPHQWERLVKWSQQVHALLTREDDPERHYYMRNPKNDDFIGFLFPELQPALEERAGVWNGENWIAPLKRNARGNSSR